MKHWTEGDVLSILSLGDGMQTSRLCRLLVDDGPPGLFASKSGEIIKSMIDGMKSGGFPKLTPKQSEFAAVLLKGSAELLDALIAILNRREHAGSAPKFVDPTRPDPTPAPRPKRPVTSDSHLEPAAINANWGMF